jgi:hypothetical protein
VCTYTSFAERFALPLVSLEGTNEIGYGYAILYMHIDY